MKKNIPFLLIITILLGIASVAGGYFLVRQRQQIQEKAAPATKAYFSQESLQKNVGQSFDINVLVDTGSNSLAVVRLDIDYNQTILEVTGMEFNNQLLPQSLRAIDYTSQPGKISGSAGVSPGTSVNGSNQRIATISFAAIAEKPGGTLVSFGTNTTAYPATADEDPGVNLITQKESLTVKVLPSGGGGGGGNISPTPEPTVTPQPTTPTPSPIPTAVPTTSPASPTSEPTSSIPTLAPTVNTEEVPETAFSLPTVGLFSAGALIVISALFAL